MRHCLLLLLFGCTDPVVVLGAHQDAPTDMTELNDLTTDLVPAPTDLTSSLPPTDLTSSLAPPDLPFSVPDLSM
jgi:hypothetical protein